MSLDLFSCMKGFVAVAEYRGFSQAARHTFVSTPTLTNQLQRLESLLKKRLFHRTTRRVELTEAGRVYLAQVKKVLAEVELAQSSVIKLERAPHGLLTLGIPSLFHSRYFVEQLKGFLQRYPKIQLKIVDENSPGALLEGAVDLVISGINVRDKQLIKERWFAMQSSIYAAPAYIKKHGTPAGVEDLKNYNCLVNLCASPTSEWILANNKKVYVQGNYISTSGVSILQACLAGLGLMWAADISIKEEVRGGKLVEVPLGKTRITMYYYYRPVDHGHIIKLMADYLKNVVSRDFIV